MLAKLQIFASLYRELGLRWSVFRLTYAFRLRTGLIRKQMPQYRWEDRPLETWLKNNQVGAGSPRPAPAEIPRNVLWDSQTAVIEADRIINGELQYFAHTWIDTGFPPNWHKDPISGIELDSTKHWSQLSDDSEVDIKFIWEPNRFAFVYTLVRAYVATHDEKYVEAFWTLIEDWAKNNLPNTGPNWMDGQEIALRLMAWTFGYDAFLNSPTSTAERKENFVIYVAAQAERIYKNLGYAISTKSNHTISEAFGLWMVSLLFPELKDSEKYLSFGKQLLEQEAVNQIFPDGTYSMYSLNYHRFILNIYLYAIRFADINHSPFSKELQNSVRRSIEYLSNLIDPQTGQIPVYGSNDGALVLPLNNCDFTDYRPLLQLGWYLTKGERLFDPGPWDEDIFWLCGADSLSSRSIPEGDKREMAGVRVQTNSFSHGGTYLLQSSHSHTVLRCTDFTSRPSHADQLHMDLWIHGHNLAIDAGTYLYSGQSPWRNGLARTSVHNTVTVDNKDQMTMLSRFTWTNWSKAKVLKHEKDIWQGEHDGYKPVSHKRTVMVLENDRWLVIDTLSASESHHYTLHWLLADGEYGIQKLSAPKGYASGFGFWLKPSTSSLVDSKFNIQMGLVDGKGNFSLVRADVNSTRGWRSRYYGHKEPAISAMLETDQPQVTFWSFFGFEEDLVEVAGNVLRIDSQTVNLNEMK